jgi:hypothetical protein
LFSSFRTAWILRRTTLAVASSGIGRSGSEKGRKKPRIGPEKPPLTRKGKCHILAASRVSPSPARARAETARV